MNANDPITRNILSALHDLLALRDYPETFTAAKHKEIADHAARSLEAALRSLGLSTGDVWDEMAALQGSATLEDWIGPRHKGGHR